MKYEPPIDRKKAEFIQLIEEYFSISNSGFMRMHAQDREHDAIFKEIADRLEENVFHLDDKQDYWICDMTEATKKEWEEILKKFKYPIKLLILIPNKETEKDNEN